MSLGRFGKVGNKYSANDQEFLTRVKDRYASKGFRADLHLMDSKVEDVKQEISVGFHPTLGQPTLTEIKAFVTVNFPNMNPDWRTLRPGDGYIKVAIESNADRILVEDYSKIPPAFKSIGTAMYKEASSGSIWALNKEGDSLVLVRQSEEVAPEDIKAFEAVKIGDFVLTPLGKGEVLAKSASKVSVKLAENVIRDFSPRDITAQYDLNKERSMLTDYYTKAYGIPEFAKALTEDYGRKG